MRNLGMIAGAAVALMLAACGSDTLSTTGGSGGGGAVSTVAVTSSAASIAAGATATITATAADSSGTPVAGATITFTTSAGTLSAASGVTDSTGTATTTLTASASSSGTVITVTGADGSITGKATVSVAASTVLSMGSGTGAEYQAGKLAVSTASLSAGGSTSLQVELVNQTGVLYTTATAITFSSPCQSQGLASIAATGVTPASPTVTTSTGSASATYVAKGCIGSDVITASATANSQSLSASGTVTVAEAAIGSIAFISATPQTITLKGVGSIGGASTSTVIFQVLDVSGGPRAEAPVTFTLSTQVGGITFTPASATSDVNGNVQTVVSGGTVATVVRVTAATIAGGSTISTQSSNLTVTTGIPTSNNISLAVKCQNVEAWDIDGVTVPVTVSMTDRFSNPVPPGTTANFVTTLGGIDASCQTVAATGICSVNWHSQAPYSVAGNPATTVGTGYTNTADNWCSASVALPYCTGTTNGRSPIVVTAIGEESFVDANGNGIFDAGDTVAFDPNDGDNVFPITLLPKPWQDTQEPFLNQWELYDTYGTPVWIAGEFFLDFNQNGTHDGPDNLFNGPLCSGPLCSPKTTAPIGTSNIIVLSGQHANATILGTPPFTLPANINMYIYDDRYQQMPAGTLVTYSFSTNAGTASGPTPAAWPCSAATPVFDTSGNVVSAGQFFSLGGSPPETGAVPGDMYVTVTTPLGFATTFVIPVTN